MESPDIISPLNLFAHSTAKPLLPDAVGPAITRTFFISVSRTIYKWRISLILFRIYPIAYMFWIFFLQNFLNLDNVASEQRIIRKIALQYQAVAIIAIV